MRLLDVASGRARASRARTRTRSRGVAFARRRALDRDHGRGREGRGSGTSPAAGSPRCWRATSAARSTGSTSRRDGRTAYSGGYDGRVLIWDVAGDRRLDTPFDAGPPFVAPDDRFPRGLALSPDGSVFAVGADRRHRRSASTHGRCGGRAASGRCAATRRRSPSAPTAGCWRSPARTASSGSSTRGRSGRSRSLRGMSGVVPGDRVLARRRG